ncbi:hypothetical protein SISSUDRAFT_1048745 [Sistotremastrum suecicum HHB10207 ss-3]|uniref:F-box domain-containing protein n=1 Tax=Sistotremastrum suecicum HHB10207 ss-3 TaxID=1314776 RepID=A0A166C925_9AGAM|nr:hypothetical protein SISSUDRAFT_1048745 [Sistotremastrum suecicum HHB10207 ss-3]
MSTTSPASGVEMFPNEIFELIFLGLDVRTLVRCKTLSRRLFYIIQGSASLTYKIELRKDGLEDFPSNHTSAQKLQKLLERRHSWATMQPARTIRANLDRFGHFHVSGGLLVVALPPPNEDVDMDSESDEDSESDDEQIFGKSLKDVADSVEGHIDDDEDFEYVAKFLIMQLPNVHTGEGIKIRFVYEMEVNPTEFLFDHSQDLLVIMHWEPQLIPGPGEDDLVRIHLYLRTLSDNTPHPLAHRPHLGPIHVQQNTAAWGAVDLHLAGDKLALVDNEDLRIWNWKTGTLLANVEMLGTARSFGFLSPYYFVTTYGWATCEPLRLYALGPWPNTDPNYNCALLAHLFLPSIGEHYIDEESENLCVTDNIFGSLERPIWGPDRMFGPSDDNIRALVFDSGIDLVEYGTYNQPHPDDDDYEGTGRRMATTVMIVKNRRLVDIANAIMRARSIQDIQLGPTILTCANWADRVCTFLKALPPLAETRRGDTWTDAIEGNLALLSPLLEERPSAHYVSDFGIPSGGVVEGPEVFEPPRPLSFTRDATQALLHSPTRRMPFKDRRIPFTETGDDFRSTHENVIHQDCLIKIKRHSGGGSYVLEILVFG